MAYNQGAAANRRPAEQADGADNLSAVVAADRAFPAVVAELGSLDVVAMIAAQDTFRGFAPVIFLVFLISFIVSYAMMAQLHRVLRERHPAIYDSLGQPTLFWNNSMKNSFAVLGFILSGRFRETHDAEVIRLCRFIRAFNYAYLAFFVAVMVAGFVLSAR